MRQLSITLILFALLLATVIFVAGISIGSMIDKGNTDELGQKISSLSDRTNANTAIMLLENSSEYCPLLDTDLEQIDSDANYLSYQIAYLEETKEVEVTDLKSRYFNLELNSYLLSNRVRTLCGENFSTILYFYSNKNCLLDCREQGAQLLELRKDTNFWVKIYSFDNEIGSPAATVLAKKFNVTKYPSVVVNGKTYEGVLDAGKLKTALSQAQ